MRRAPYETHSPSWSGARRALVFSQTVQTAFEEVANGVVVYGEQWASVTRRHSRLPRQT